MCRAATSCLWNTVSVHVQIQLIPNESQGASLLRRCTFGLSRRLFTVLYFSVRSSRSKTLRYKQSSWISIFFKSTISPPCPHRYKPRRLVPRYIWNQDGRPYRKALDPDDVTKKEHNPQRHKLGEMRLLTIFSAFCARLSSYSCSRSWTKKKKRQNQFFVELHRGRDLRCVSHTRPVTLQTPLEFNACDWITTLSKNSITKQFFFCISKVYL